MDKFKQTGVATLTQALSADASAPVQLLPAGIFRASDGRPEGLPGWVCDAVIAAKLITRSAQRTNMLPFDYEHQTMNAEFNGLPAPAAGWFKEMQWQDGVGLFAINVEWTPAARTMIANGEYKYISPVFRFDQTTGEVLEILNAALTNNPALDNMAAVALRRWNDNQPEKEEDVNELLKKLLAALGLPATTSEADALAACSALKTKADDATAALSASTTELAALKASPAAPDPAKFVPIAMLHEVQTKLAALSANTQGAELEQLITAALADGRLVGDSAKEWAGNYGKADLVGLKKYLAEVAAPIAALKGTQTNGAPPKAAGADAHGLTENQLAICKRMNIKPEDYAKQIGTKAA